MDYDIRPARPSEWAKAKALRLTALRDPIARSAFASTYEQEAGHPDEFWQRRASGNTTFVAVEPSTGAWVGTATVLVETEARYPVPQTHVVGMYVLPEHRGSGAAEALVRAGVEWSWRRPEIARVRLWCSDGNPRAFSFYTRLGFAKTGVSAPHPPDPTLTGFELALDRPLDASEHP
ncbi:MULTISPECIES: GNAT family N-acetyltransferase [Streptomycetaceae]|uniref:Acetyltransferase n=1 Tax=Streptantibioticus cattleyicolor (strain ATCC 35852 / DSM 46488 / JCM 4925 / NBRC 14057 / NRRL 8057) TaxID=1003195 RepID=F8K266_STREN|nr:MULTISPECIES: GNAT family N-acetyltransferase [Streptomycetaceae]AEW94954.1 acetyltransferase [Streptantibioticus cattleyicolor NRRL 8057 = DSM 46488]MYS59557.1 GNAT family N-acetyltransferase [Streptomyces sp. SID5468]CCB75302.1 putative acetyltransferase [Streptantibioticus cattleyicolor NRRL 8057 = DSM 46488]